MKKLIITSLFTLLLLVFPSITYAQTASGSVNQIVTFLKSIVGILSTLGGIVAVIFFSLGGIKYMTSSGNPQSLEQAKKTIIYSAVGLSIVLGSYLLSSIVTQLATSAFGSSGQ